MKIIYTKHAEDKLKRTDIRAFKINKKNIKQILNILKSQSRTIYGDYTAVAMIDEEHDLRVIYDIIDNNIKVITFHIARKGRYQ